MIKASTIYYKFCTYKLFPKTSVKIFIDFSIAILHDDFEKGFY